MEKNGKNSKSLLIVDKSDIKIIIKYLLNPINLNEENINENDYIKNKAKILGILNFNDILNDREIVLDKEIIDFIKYSNASDITGNGFSSLQLKNCSFLKSIILDI